MTARRGSSARARQRQRRERVADAVLYVWRGGIALTVAGTVALFAWGAIESDPAPMRPLAPPVEPSDEPTLPLVVWEVVEVTCADGWDSPSIGEVGACSHHGGVVTRWSGSDGQTLSCAGSSEPPRTELSQRRQHEQAGRLYCEGW